MVKSIVAAALAALLASSSMALAGGFAIREQSTIGQGTSFAGVAAGGGGLSSLFWNPAVSSEYNEFGFISENNAALILPYASTEGAGLFDSGNIGDWAVVPAGYYSYAWNDQITFAGSVNAPFGLVTDGRDGWAGNPFGDKSDVKTYNFNPSMSYKINDMLSVGVGAQVQYMGVHLTNRTAPAGVQFVDIEGDDIGIGFTAGVLFKPTDMTEIGLGFRSSVKHTLKGDGFFPAPPTTGISAKFTAPEMVTLGVSHQVSDQLKLLAGVEWSNWSRFKELRVINDATGAPFVPVTDFSWKDSWYYSLGAEYAYSDVLTLRAGAAYEKSPVPDATRSVRVPDNDRIWLSAGASYRFSEKMVANLAYSHVFIDDGDVLLPAVSFNQHVNIISVGLTRDW
jgi:long-chain fatty acid transport protein